MDKLIPSRVLPLRDPWHYYRSSWMPPRYGYPQSSVIGPILYSLYTSGLASLLVAHAVQGQQYANDVQAYVG